MARNKSLVPVSPDTVVDGVNVIYIGTLEDALFPGEKSYLIPYDVRNAAVVKWMKRNGAHYYAEEKFSFDEDDRCYAAFSVRKGISQAKRYGYRTVVCENLS